MQISVECSRMDRPLKFWIEAVWKALLDLEITHGLWELCCWRARIHLIGLTTLGISYDDDGDDTLHIFIACISCIL